MKLFFVILLISLSLAYAKTAQKTPKMGKEAVDKMLEELCTEILTKKKARYYYGLQFAKFCESAYEHKIQKQRLKRNAAASQMFYNNNYLKNLLQNYDDNQYSLRNKKSINKRDKVFI